MRHTRRRAAGTLLGLAGVVAAVALDAPPTGALAVTGLYAGVGYYAAAHPVVLWGSERSRPDWTAGAMGGGLTLGLVGLVNADVAPWLLVLGFGFVSLGFVTGVAYALDSPESSDVAA